MNVEIPKALHHRLTEAARALGKTEPECVAEALADWLEDLEDARAYREALEAWERDGRRTVPLEEVRLDHQAGKPTP